MIYNEENFTEGFFRICESQELHDELYQTIWDGKLGLHKREMRCDDGSVCELHFHTDAVPSKIVWKYDDGRNREVLEANRASMEIELNCIVDHIFEEVNDEKHTGNQDDM